MVRRKDRSEQGLDIARPGQDRRSCKAGKSRWDCLLSSEVTWPRCERPPAPILTSIRRSPFFQRLLRVSGFSTEAEKAEQGAAAEALSDRFLDAVCLIGSIEVCRERLSAFRAAGLDLPI